MTRAYVGRFKSDCGMLQDSYLCGGLSKNVRIGSCLTTWSQLEKCEKDQYMKPMEEVCYDRGWGGCQAFALPLWTITL